MQVIEVIITRHEYVFHVSFHKEIIVFLESSIRWVNFDFFFNRVVNMLFINVCVVEQRDIRV